MINLLNYNILRKLDGYSYVSTLYLFIHSQVINLLEPAYLLNSKTMNTKIIQIRAFCRQFYWTVFLILSCVLGGNATAGTIVRIATSVGDYSIELFDQEAPITVENFLNYVRNGDYNRTYLHRVVDDFVVQGGGYRFELFVGPIDVASNEPIKNEFGASNIAGTVAMALARPGIAGPRDVDGPTGFSTPLVHRICGNPTTGCAEDGLHSQAGD